MLGGAGLLVACTFALIVFGLGRPPSEHEGTLLAFAVMAAVVSAVTWVPIRGRLRPLAMRLVHGDPRAPDQALRVFGARLARALPLDELLLELVETLRRTLALEVAEVWIATDSLLERAASDPALPAASVVLTEREVRVLARAGVSGAAWAEVWLPIIVESRGDSELRVAPIVNSGELLGLVVVQRGSDGEPFRADEERVLAELSRQVGLAFRNLRLDSALQSSLDELRRQATELRASRARVVAAADAERRRIERDIHDGAQQQLIALAVNLRTARELAGPSPEESRALLDQVGSDLHDALENVRALAHGIYPPLLLESGLGPALRAAAARASLGVRCDLDRLGRYPADVEATVYFCCLEALQNAAKHAGASARVTLRVQADSGALRFEVCDDGPGFSPQQHADGAGLQNMADRVGAAGGKLSIASRQGEGTSVAGRIPIEP